MSYLKLVSLVIRPMVNTGHLELKSRSLVIRPRVNISHLELKPAVLHFSYSKVFSHENNSYLKLL